jgi:hypothetical protein
MSNRFEVAAHELEAYERDGVVCLRNVVPPARCRQMLSAVHAYLERGQGRIQEAKTTEDGPRLIGAVFMSVLDKEFREFSRDSALPEVAAQLMRVERVRFFTIGCSSRNRARRNRRLGITIFPSGLCGAMI